MRIKELSEFLKKNKIPAYRLKQILRAVYHDGVSSFLEITTLSKELREKLNTTISILPFKVEKILGSTEERSFKALLKLEDGERIETALLSPMPGSWSACISSQSGCALGCSFCATGIGGFKRNLTGEEIEAQVLFWKQHIRKNNISGKFLNIVFMGMGEPFLNYDEVRKSLNNLTDAETFNFGQRHISVSTVGIPEGIKKFSKDFPQINLAVSLAAADDKTRQELLPINSKHNLADLKKALEYYFTKTNRKVFFEYIMLDGINDKQISADDLINYIHDFKRPDLLHVNLIRYNTTSAGLKSSPRETVKWFKEYLIKNRTNATIRKSLGSEINGACGQLAEPRNS